MKYFFELIQVAVGTRKTLSESIGVEEWKKIFREATRQALIGVLYDAITRLPKEQIPPKGILFQWYGLAEKIKDRNRQINQEAVRLGIWLEQENMDYTILKGQGIATLYPNPLLRTPGDIDVWVRPENYKQISLSERRNLLVDFAKKSGPVDSVCYHHLHLPFSKITEVELHFTPSWKYNWWLNKRIQHYFSNIDTKEYTKEVLLSDEAGKIQIPTPEFNAFYILLHIYHHLFGEGIDLRQLMDYYYVLNRKWEPDAIQRIHKLLREQHMMKFASAIMYVLKTVFHMDDSYLIVPVNEKEGRFVLKEILLAGNFGQYDKRIKHCKNENTLAKFLRSLRRLMKFTYKYPWEVLSNPFFRIHHYFYRKYRGWR